MECGIEYARRVWLGCWICLGYSMYSMNEIVFKVEEDEVDGGYTASALGYGIHTQASTVDELKQMVREAVECFFDSEEDCPSLIHFHIVRDEVFAR